MEYHYRIDKAAVLICVLMTVGIHLGATDDVPKEDLEHYGNVISQVQLVTNADPKIYVDHEVELEWGFLYKFSVFIGNYTETVKKSSPRVRLQVWTAHAEGFTVPEYSLKWQHILTVNNGGNKVYEVVVPASERVEINSQDRIGVTAEERNFPVAMDFVYQPSIYDTDFKYVRDGKYPEVGNEIHFFEEGPLPLRFSIGVSLVPYLTLTREDDQEFCGSEIKFRKSHIYPGAHRVWMDDSIKLVPGVLEKVAFFAADIPRNEMEDDPSFILQIWTPASSDTEFTLKWEHTIALDQGFNRVYQVDIKEEDSVTVDEADKVGWLFTGDVGYIAYSFNPSHKTYTCTECVKDGLPSEGGTFTFDLAGRPNQFAVGVFVRKDSGSSGGALSSTYRTNTDVRSSSTSTANPTTTTQSGRKTTTRSRILTSTRSLTGTLTPRNGPDNSNPESTTKPGNIIGGNAVDALTSHKGLILSLLVLPLIPNLTGIIQRIV